MLSRIPIRVKLTLAFAAVMAVVLAATGAFLYLQFRADLNHTIDQGLRTRANDVAALIEQADSGLSQSGRSPVTERGESFAQILGAHGRILDATPRLRRRALLDPATLRRALHGTLLLDRGSLPGLEHSRLLATPVHAQDQRLVVVVGVSLEPRDTALDNLAALLTIGESVALVLALLAGYGVAAAALRAVESMRRRAAMISATQPGRRLPVPPARDELARLGETLNEMLARLESAFERERAFVSDASHELRTPLAILKTELELALHGRRSVGELREALGSAAEETDRVAQLAEDLLVIARSDQGRLPVRLADIDAAELLAGVRERFLSRTTEHGRVVEVDTGRAARLVADPLRIEQALGNMIDNALRYGAGPVRLAVAEGESGGSVELHVRDAGAGFPPSFLDTAFERFTRADAARGRGGAGLGLAIVAAIAAAHEGSAHAANPPGGGADVWIALPGVDPTRPGEAPAHRDARGLPQGDPAGAGVNDAP